jgi:hypothetical protein
MASTLNSTVVTAPRSSKGKYSGHSRSAEMRLWSVTASDQPSANKFDLLANAVYATGDPGFVGAAKGDFRLKLDAEVFCRIGFHPIPVEEIGLYHDDSRTN